MPRESQDDDELIGCYERKIDPKGRVSIPSVLKNGDQRFIVSIKGDHLEVIPHSKWHELAKERLSQSDSSSPGVIRKWLGQSFASNTDPQGRIRLTEDCLKIIRSNGDHVIFIGLNDKIEIWSPKKWKKILAANS